MNTIPEQDKRYEFIWKKCFYTPPLSLDNNRTGDKVWRANNSA